MIDQLRRIDIHAHVHFPEFDPDREAVIARALEAGTAMVNVGTGLDTSRAAIALAEKYPVGAYAVVGQHPVDKDPAVSEGQPFDREAYKALAAHPKVVGIGECGLDYFRMEESVSAARQKEIFIEQIMIANECKKPLMLHIRDAYGDALDILKREARVLGNSHFFAGTIDDAKRFLDLGFTLSFTGVITFAKQYIELVEYVPLDMMHAETDCPFVAPMPHRGKRNEPLYVAEVIDKIARIKKLPVEEVEKALLGNARRMWGIPL